MRVSAIMQTDLVTTAPGVLYRVTTTDGDVRGRMSATPARVTLRLSSPTSPLTSA